MTGSVSHVDKLCGVVSASQIYSDRESRRKHKKSKKEKKSKSGMYYRPMVEHLIMIVINRAVELAHPQSATASGER